MHTVHCTDEFTDACTDTNAGTTLNEFSCYRIKTHAWAIVP